MHTARKAACPAAYMQRLQSSLVWTTTSCIAVKQARRSREIRTSDMRMTDPN